MSVGRGRYTELSGCYRGVGDVQDTPNTHSTTCRSQSPGDDSTQRRRGLEAYVFHADEILESVHHGVQVFSLICALSGPAVHRHARLIGSRETRVVRNGTRSALSQQTHPSAKLWVQCEPIERASSRWVAPSLQFEGFHFGVTQLDPAASQGDDAPICIVTTELPVGRSSIYDVRPWSLTTPQRGHIFHRTLHSKIQ